MTDDDVAARVQQAVADLLAAQAAAIEEAVEKAIQGGEHGVLVIRHRNGDLEVGVHPSVPYGVIHERSSDR